MVSVALREREVKMKSWRVEVIRDSRRLGGSLSAILRDSEGCYQALFLHVYGRGKQITMHSVIGSISFQSTTSSTP